MLVGIAADDDGLAAIFRMIELLDAGKECIEVDEKHGLRPGRPDNGVFHCIETIHDVSLS